MKSKIFPFAALTVIAAVIALSSVSLRGEDAATTAPATSPATQTEGTKFYGSVSAVDTTANTFTVGDQTFSVVAATKMSKADDSEGTLADAVVGQPARGVYTKTADGKLEVSKVRFGKKTGGKAGGGKGGKKKDAAAATQAN